MQNFIVPIIAAISLLSAGASGVNLVKLKISEPLIEGWAVRTTPVRAGEEIRLEWNITKRTDCHGSVGRVWEGSDGFRATEVKRLAALPNTNTETKYRVPTIIPALAPTGVLTLTVKGYYDCKGGRKYWALRPVDMVVIN